MIQKKKIDVLQNRTQMDGDNSPNSRTILKIDELMNKYRNINITQWE
jgi:hypothetical protein